MTRSSSSSTGIKTKDCFGIILLSFSVVFQEIGAAASVVDDVIEETTGIHDVAARFISSDAVLVTWSLAPGPSQTDSPIDVSQQPRHQQLRHVEIVTVTSDSCDADPVQRHLVIADIQQWRMWFSRGANMTCVRLDQESSAWNAVTLHDGIHIPAQVRRSLPVEIIYTHGEVLLFSCPATGYPQPIVRWYKDDTILVNDDHFQVFGGGNLRIEADDADIEGAYACRASNDYGSSLSNTMTLRKALLHQFHADEQQRMARVAIGDGMQLECRPPFSVPPPQIIWQKVTSDMDSIPRTVHLDDRVTQGFDGSLLFVWTEERDEGLYQCHVVNNYLDVGTSGSLANLTLYEIRKRKYAPQRLFSSPATKVALLGSTAKLQCVFSGKPAPTTVWYHANRRVQPDQRRSISASGQILTLTSVSAEDEGVYVCEAFNSVPFSRSPRLELRVLVHAPPVFNEVPVSQNVTAGNTVTMTCTASGVPAPEVTWSKDGQSLTEGYITSRPGMTLSADGRQLTLQNLRSHDTASFHCQASNIHATILSSFYINVHNPTQITSEATNVVLNGQKTVTFPCLAETDPGTPLSILWYRGQNSQPITMEKNRIYMEDDNSLVLNLTNEEDGGKSFVAAYTCVASNGVSTDNATARLRPNLDTLPSPASVHKGANIPAVALYAVVSVGLLCVLVTIVTLISYVRKRKQMRSRLNTDASEMSQLSTLSRRAAEEALSADLDLNDGKFPVSVKDESLRACVQDVYIDRERLQIASLIGKGQFGRVYAAVLVDPRGKLREKVAVKTLKYKAEETEMVELFLREAMMMRDFRHLHVLSLIGISVDTDGSPMVVLPFMANGDLRNYILNPVMDITVLELLKLGIQVARGMVYLSSMRFVHRDLAARNCMVDSDGLVRVADFGLSRELFKQDYYRIDNGKTPLPIRWMAPECLDRSVFTTMSDMWSMGVLLWELMTRGAVPYPDVDNWNIATYIKSHRRLAQPAYCPSSVYGVMVKTWAENPHDRPTFTALVSELEGILRTAAQPKSHNTGPGPAVQATHLYANIVSPACPMITDYRHTTV